VKKIVNTLGCDTTTKREQAMATEAREEENGGKHEPRKQDANEKEAQRCLLQ